MATAQVVRFQTEPTTLGPSTSKSSPPKRAVKNGNGLSPLMLACQQGRSEDVRQILKRKGGTRERTRNGRTAFHYCAETTNRECLDILIDEDSAYLNAKDEEGYTPLHLAVINGNRDIVKTLVGRKADVNCLDNEKHSPVHWATVCGEVEILDILLSNGASPTNADIHSAHPIHYAAQMCGKVNSDSPARVQSTVYGISPKKGLAILRRLVEEGAPVNVRDKDGRQPLLWASSAGSSDAILSLVNAGASVLAEDKDGLTALHCAASRGHTDCLETLIGLCGSEVDVIDNNGCTALFYAVTLGHADATELLLNYGSEPNRQDRKGRTPAHCGASKGQLETIRLLSRHGSNLWMRNVRGDLPLHEAVISRRRDLVMWLLSLSPESVNAPNNDGRSPIHMAALNNNVEMVKILIDHHSDINPLMRSGKGIQMTPLDAAIHRGNSAVAKFLQLHGGIPANSLNDAAFQRRLNRTLESQPGSSMGVTISRLGLHNEPELRNLASPDAFGDSFMATSTPIMPEDEIKNDDESGPERSKRKSDKRRKKRTSLGKGQEDGGSTDSGAEQELRGSRKNSRKSSRKNSREGKSSEEKSRPASSEKPIKEETEKKPTGKERLTMPQSDDKFSELEYSAQTSQAELKREGTLEGTEIRNSRSLSKEDSQEDTKKKAEMKSRASSRDKVDEEGKEEKERKPLRQESQVENITRQESLKDIKPGKEFKGRSRGDSQEKILKPDSAEKVTRGESEDRVIRDESPSKLDRGKSEERIVRGESKEKVMRGESKERVVRDESRDKVMRGESEERTKEELVKRQSQEKVERGQSQEQIIKRAEPEEKMKREKSQERRQESVEKRRTGSIEQKEKEVKRMESKEEKGSKEIEESKETHDSADKERRKSIMEKKRESLEERLEVRKKSISEAKEKREFLEKEKRESLDKKPSLEKKSSLDGASKTPKEKRKSIIESKGKSISDSKEKADEMSEGPTNKLITKIVLDDQMAPIPSHPTKEIPRTPIKIIPQVEEPPDFEELELERRSFRSPIEREIEQLEKFVTYKKAEPKPESKPNSKTKQNVKKPSQLEFIPQTEHVSRRDSMSDIDDLKMPILPSMNTESFNDLRSEMFSPPKPIISQQPKKKSVTSLSPQRPIKTTTFIPSDTSREGSPEKTRKESVSKPIKKMVEPVKPLSVDQDVDLSDNSTTLSESFMSASEFIEKRHERKQRVYAPKPRNRLTFGDDTRIGESRIPPKFRKGVDVDTPISVTQAMQASMRKYHLERKIFQELLELKRLQIRAGKSNEQVLVKRLSDSYKKAGLSINFREYDGPFTFRSFEKYLYDQLRLLQANRRLLPRFAPSDDLEKLSVALKKMNSTKLPFLDDVERGDEGCEDHNQCTHLTHRCHHAAHAYTGVPCAAYIGNGRKAGFLPRVDPLKAPGPTQRDNVGRTNNLKLSSSRDDTQSPITLEVQQGSKSQVFALPSQTLDPTKNYYVSLSIKPTTAGSSLNPSPIPITINASGFQKQTVSDDGSISAPPPNDNAYISVDEINRDKHNVSL